ncbi:uncharacterized protein [Temnothorax nylanderi]|uniref:uncharacterized protein n=1 Tax=Temnothorax nylanderi TaxID=102681 RepID=UPI003A8A07E7
MSHDSLGNNYNSSSEYLDEMSKLFTYGGLCELVAAGQLFGFVFEVYRNGELYESFGEEGNPVRRIRFTQDISKGHFDEYEQSETEEENNKSSFSQPDSNSDFAEPTFIPVPNKAHGKRRTRYTNAKRRKQLKNASRKYVQNNPEVNRAAVARYQQKNPEVIRRAVARYQQKNPEVNRRAVAKYQQKNPEVHRGAESRYEQSNPGRRVERRVLPWMVKAHSGMAYDPDVAYETESIIALGTMSHKCKYCNALKWKEESPGMCCNNGKVQLASLEPLPEPLYSLVMGRHPEHVHFMNNIRKYNGCFSMTSFGGKQVLQDGFIPTFKVQGQVYHLVGSLLPLPEQEAQFLQIYFVGEDDREVRLRCSNFSDVKQVLVKELQRMLHDVNSYIKDLKTTLDKVSPNCKKFEVVIHADRKPDDAHRGRFNAPIVNEVALVIVGQQFDKRDIVLQSHDNKLRRISEVHRSYDALQYPLMFCRGEDGYSIAIPQRDPQTKLQLKNLVSAASFYSYRIMIREGEVNHLVYFRSLFSQFLVDMYAKIETERLNYSRNNQAQLRAESYIHLRDAVGRQDADVSQLGKMVVLPSSFTGGPRYMYERTQDAITYVRYHGRPDLFITFTCNPKWKDITDALLPGQKTHDRHDIIARVFHLKVKKMMALLNKGSLFGKVCCYMYSVEWQKRGLPHIHILLWLEQRIFSDMIDKVICAEIPDPLKDSLLHNIVKANMIHGPCGGLNYNSPCMKEGRCSKRYPRIFKNDTQTGGDGYPQYRRRSPADGGYTVEINGIELDNRWVVPYNPVLLRIFNAHINVELCNSVKSIKYICKYVNKGSDQAVFALESEKNEVKMYENGRYINLRTVNGVLCPTFQSTCKALGLLEDDKQWDNTLEEAVLCDSSLKLRELFRVMLAFCQLSEPLSLWEKYKDSFSEDIMRQVERELKGSAQNMIDEVYNRCLVMIEDAVMALGGQELEQYGLPQPKRFGGVLGNRDYLRETNYDVNALEEVVSNNEGLLTDEQFVVYRHVLSSVESGGGQVFFLDAPGGTGKTFLINLLLARVRRERGIALAVASSGIAATLLEGGRTAHAAFKLPLNLIQTETPLCNISKQSNMAKVLRDCKLIVWDESTMAHKGGFEALSTTLKDIRGNDGVMGGVTVLLAGDFRQTLPIVPRGTRADEVKACVKKSHLWSLIKKISIRKNMRVHLKGDVFAGQFSKILLKIGDGEYSEIEGKVIIPASLGLVVKTLESLINKIYPDIANIKEKSMDWLSERAILTPRNDKAGVINDILLKSFEEGEINYRSVDSVVDTDDAVNYPVEFLNTMNPPGLPAHKLFLKVGAPVMLLRNLNPPKLCNGTRLQVKALYRNVIEATIYKDSSRILSRRILDKVLCVYKERVLVRLQETGAVRLQETGAVRLQETGAVRVQETGAVRLQETGAVRLQETGAVRLKGTGAVRLQETGAVRLKRTGAVRLQGTGAVRLQGTAAVRLQGTAAVRLQETGAVRLQGTGAVRL